MFLYFCIFLLQLEGLLGYSPLLEYKYEHPKAQNFIDLDHKKRAEDIQESFEALKESGKELYILAGGLNYEKVESIKSTKNGTNLLVRYKAFGKSVEKLIKLSDFEDMGVREPMRSKVKWK